MPYRNYQSRSRRFNGRRSRGFKSRRPPQSQFQKYANMAYKGFRLATKVAGMVNVEYKVNETFGNVSPGSITPTIQLMNGIATGDDYTNRDGRQVRIKSLQTHIRFLINPASTTGIAMFRWMLFIDKQPDVGVPLLPDVLDVTTAASIDAFRNLNNRKRFVILKDKRGVIALGPGSERVQDYYKKMDLKTVYDGTGATDASIDGGALYLMVWTDQSANIPSCVYATRVRFIDN